LVPAPVAGRRPNREQLEAATMHDTAADVADGSDRRPLGPLPGSPPAPGSRWRTAAAVLLAPLSYVRRRPRRALAWLAVLALAGLLGALGMRLWAEYHLQAARRAVRRGHNAVAVRHLLACRRVRPDDPEVLLLSARVARRSGAWTEARVLLDRYWQQRGDDDPLVLERLLLRATRGEVEAVQPLLQLRI